MNSELAATPSCDHALHYPPASPGGERATCIDFGKHTPRTVPEVGCLVWLPVSVLEVGAGSRGRMRDRPTATVPRDSYLVALPSSGTKSPETRCAATRAK